MGALKPEFLRAHPVRSGMLWAAPLCVGSLLGNWLFGQFNLVFVATVIALSVAGGLTWGYAMKSYYDGSAAKK